MSTALFAFIILPACFFFPWLIASRQAKAERKPNRWAFEDDIPEPHHVWRARLDRELEAMTSVDSPKPRSAMTDEERKQERCSPYKTRTDIQRDHIRKALSGSVYLDIVPLVIAEPEPPTEWTIGDSVTW